MLQIDSKFYEDFIHEEKREAPFKLFETINDVKDIIKKSIQIRKKHTQKTELELYIDNIDALNTSKNPDFVKLLIRNLRSLKSYFERINDYYFARDYIITIMDNCYNFYEKMFYQNIKFAKLHEDEIKKYLNEKILSFDESYIKPEKPLLTEEEKKEHHRIAQRKHYENVLKQIPSEKAVFLTEEEKIEHRKISKHKYYETHKQSPVTERKKREHKKPLLTDEEKKERKKLSNQKTYAKRKEQTENITFQIIEP